MGASSNLLSSLIISVILLSGIASFQPFVFAQEDSAKLVETVELDDIKLKEGEVIVLLDVSDLGTIDTVHVAANLPCNDDDGPDDGAGNDTPDVKIIAGNAGTGMFGDVIESTADDTGFVGPKKTCVFHDTVSSGDIPGGIITDIVLQNASDEDVKLKNVVVTITINDPSGIASILSQLEAISTEVTNIEAKLDDSLFGLAALQSLLDQILALVLGIDTEVTNIEAKLDDGTTGLAAIQGNIDMAKSDIGMIKTETDKIQMVKDNQYVPFKTPSTIAFLATETCDVAGDLSAAQHQIRIDGGSDFMVTGITFKPTGVDQAADEIVISGLFVDGKSVLTRTNDLTGTFGIPFGFDIAGVPTITGGNVPTTIAALGAGSQDIVFSFSCFADSTTDITFPAGSIVVSGWKLASDTIIAAYD